MSALDQIPEGPMRDSLLEQEAAFAEEMAQRYLDAGEDTRSDILAFFESGGPRMVHEAKCALADGTPTSAELERHLNRESEYARGAREERQACLAIVAAEPELPGPIPWRLWWRALWNPEETIRTAVIFTKAGIAQRIKERAAEPESEAGA